MNPTWSSMPAWRACWASIFTILISVATAEDRPELAGFDRQRASQMTTAEARLVEGLGPALIDGRDASAALQAWFDGLKAAKAGEPAEARRIWQRGAGLLHALPPIPQSTWGPVPDASLTLHEEFSGASMEGATCHVAGWEVDGLKQYGILVAPPGAAKMTAAETIDTYPLLLYLHGAAFGVPLYALPWLGRIARAGYVIIGPSLRGEDLFVGAADTPSLARFRKYRSEGAIENLDGEVDDALAAVSAARKLPFVRDGAFGIIGHSFGAGVGLLVAARHPDTACMVSYDAWLTNPFRYYWDRMRRGANNWLSWAAYCNQPVREQLRGLMKRSIVHNAARIQCPLLLFVGGAYAGSVFHLSHEDLLAQLRRHGKPFRYDVVPDGGHNFVLYYDSEPARYAYEKHMAFLAEHLPPAPVTATDATRTGAPGEPEPALPAGTAPPGAATP